MHSRSQLLKTLTIFPVGIILLFVFASCSNSYEEMATQDRSPEETSHNYISDEAKEKIEEMEKAYNIRVRSEVEFSEMTRWLNGFEKAYLLLPSQVRVSIIGDNKRMPLNILFVSLPKRWQTASFDGVDNTIVINATPNPNHPFPYEYVSENGYTDEEIIYGFLHEIGHAWHYNYSGYSIVSLHIFEEGSPTRYGYYYDTTTKILIDKINSIETFAEGFALYVILPNYLKTNFPLSYGWLKEDVFDYQEYTDIHPIPSSLTARLMPVRN